MKVFIAGMSNNKEFSKELTNYLDFYCIHYINGDEVYAIDRSCRYSHAIGLTDNDDHMFLARIALLKKMGMPIICIGGRDKMNPFCKDNCDAIFHPSRIDGLAETIYEL